MPPEIATVVFAVVTVGLFAFDPITNARSSKALWLPVIWVSLAGSRTVSQWLGFESAISSVDQTLEGNSLDRNILAGLIAAGIMVLLGRRREVGAILRANTPILVFLSYGALSILWSDYSIVALKRWMKALGDLVMILIVLTDPDRTAAIKRFLARIGFLLIPASVLLIKYYPSLGSHYTRWVGKKYYTGVTLDKNMLGVICLISGLGCVWRLIEAFRAQGTPPKKQPLIAQYVLLVMVLWLFVRANSMTSLASFVLASGVMLGTSFPIFARKRAMVHLLVLSTVSFAFATLFLGFGADLVETMGRDSTLTGRTGLWSDLLRMNQQPLVGTGFESFWLGKRLEELWEIYWWRPNESHNGYLEVFLNLGWMGVSLLAIVILTGYRNVIRAFRLDPDTGGFRLAFFVTGTVYGLTEAAFRVLSPIWFIFLLGIMAIPESGQDAAQGKVVSIAQ